MINQIQLNNIPWDIIIAIIGALAWTPWIYDKLKPSRLYGTVISNFSNQGRFNDKNGTMHFLKLSISCINKNFNVNDITIQIKYKNDANWYDGKIFWARISKWAMNPQGTEHKELVIPNEDFLGFVNLFEKDKSKFYYLTFLAETKTMRDFEILRIIFHDPKGLSESIEFRSENINYDRILFDDNIWH